MTWIAELPVIWEAPDGTRTPGRLAIAAPEITADGPRCRVLLEGLGTGASWPQGMPAGSLWQALTFALHYVEFTIRGFLDAGGRVLSADGQDFGALLLAPGLMSQRPDPR